MKIHIKVCGVTNVADAIACVELGASAIGLNFVPASQRYVEVATARTISEAIGARALVVGVVANLGEGELRTLRDEAKLGCLQFHGDEPPEALLPFLPHAYKAIRVATAADVADADGFPGEHVLVDAKVTGALGGTGVRVDPALVAPLARRRKLTLAGGLRPENVAEAIAAVRPFAVDVASGVEYGADPRRKDLEAVRAFIERAASAPGF